jgi:hypothetical protein
MVVVVGLVAVETHQEQPEQATPHRQARHKETMEQPVPQCKAAGAVEQVLLGLALAAATVLHRQSQVQALLTQAAAVD